MKISMRSACARQLERPLLVAAVAFVGVSAASVQAQSLDDAVNDQLEVRNQNECDLLLNGDPNTVLIGRLREICGRGVPQGANSGTSTSSGGDSGTAASMPESVRRRLGEDDTLGDAQPVRGAFGTVSWGVSDRDITAFQDGYQGDVSGLLGGFDREFGRWVAGVTVEYWKQDGDFLGGGDFESTSIGPSLFGSTPVGEKWEAAFYGGYNSLSNERTRVANFVHLDADGNLFFPPANFPLPGRPGADFDADEWKFGGQLTVRISSGNLALVPKFAVDWKQTKFDSYRETEAVESGLALVFYDDERASLVATIGVDASVAISTKFGVVVVAEHLSYKRELDDEQRFVSVSFVDDPRNRQFRFQTEPPDEDYLQFGVDAIFLFPNQLQLLLGYEQMSSHSYLSSGVFSAGIRKEF